MGQGSLRKNFRIWRCPEPVGLHVNPWYITRYRHGHIDRTRMTRMSVMPASRSGPDMVLQMEK